MTMGGGGRVETSRFWYKTGRSRQADMVEALRHQDFVPYVNKQFRFAGWHGTLRLTRIDCANSPRPFTLLFQGPADDILPEGLYAATVDDAQRFEFYIMPIHTPEADRQDYQAVFN
jgi:hypothetical protein